MLKTSSQYTLKILVIVALLLFVPALAQADSQCTTTELDLVCDPGFVLNGIDPNGQKICVPQGGNSFGGAFVEKEHIERRTNCVYQHQGTTKTTSCEIKNPLDEEQKCSCPAGFQSVLISEVTSPETLTSSRCGKGQFGGLVYSQDIVRSYICQPYGL